MELKQDIAEVRTEIADLRTEFKQDLGDLRTEFKLEHAGVRQEIASLRLEMAALESRMLRWMGAGFAATIAVLAAMIQFAHH